MARIILYAPNVHIGGGLTLLRSAIKSSPTAIAIAFMDRRTKKKNLLTANAKVFWVKNSLLSRFISEINLYLISKPEDTVICFHGLPPLLKLAARVVVAPQNRLVLDRVSLEAYPWNVRIRTFLERLWFKYLERHASCFIAPTISMKKLIELKITKPTPILIGRVQDYLPDIAAIKNITHGQDGPEYDFIYVADGQPHKNHKNLLEAWRILQDWGLHPSLALTVDCVAFQEVCALIEHYRSQHSIVVNNLGCIERENIFETYKGVSALIYPSFVEALGLPLMEAAHFGLPIVGSELDYLRDVVDPVESFDPNSPVSIARAVVRFFGEKNIAIEVGRMDSFWDIALQ
ncbi:glycosyltransferase [Polynucleobacter necessarius]|uniref:glycosyltransferase n=1 Tax=Polynucleobacter necessarius TaxID=576610 RepID=UPI000E095A20|nr:glycosyltransferase [Polynucleobacter necessarius]